MERDPRSWHHRKDGNENQFKGFSCAGSTRGQPPEVADERGACVQVEGALLKTSGRARCATEHAAGASLRIRLLCRPADLSGDGCGGKRWSHRARYVRGRPAAMCALAPYRPHESSPSNARTPSTPFGSDSYSLDGPASGDRLKHDCQSRDVRSDDSRRCGSWRWP